MTKLTKRQQIWRDIKHIMIQAAQIILCLSVIWCLIGAVALFFALGSIGLHLDQHGDCAQYQFYCADCVNDEDRCMRCEERRAAYYSQTQRDIQRLHYLPPGPDRAKLRSKTFQGLADAMASQWGGLYEHFN